MKNCPAKAVRFTTLAALCEALDCQPCCDGRPRTPRARNGHGHRGLAWAVMPSRWALVTDNSAPPTRWLRSGCRALQ
ncbi:helix-turn-helix domain-containing protein [Micromonospora sp. CB01531]|uniref:helix-turn-helix domain-containing protein n=1 Tax=Micromonospora sp. CB01531 TaxID=1718947 RepID=UPI003FD04F77